MSKSFRASRSVENMGARKSRLSPIRQAADGCDGCFTSTASFKFVAFLLNHNTDYGNLGRKEHLIRLR